MTDGGDPDKICDLCGEEKHQGYKSVSISGMGSRVSWTIRHKECYHKIKEYLEEKLGDPSDAF